MEKEERENTGLSLPWMGLVSVFRLLLWAHCSDLKVTSLWDSRGGSHYALICWHGHLMINYGCAGSWGAAHQRLRRGILMRPAFLFRITLLAALKQDEKPQALMEALEIFSFSFQRSLLVSWFTHTKSN